MGLNPVEVPNFFRVNLQLLKLQLSLLRRSYLHLNLYFHSSNHLHSKRHYSLAHDCQTQVDFSCNFWSQNSRRGWRAAVDLLTMYHEVNTLPSFFSWFLEASIALTFRSLVHTLLLRSTVMSPSPDIASCFRVCTSTGSASKASLILLILPRNRDSDTGGLEKSQSTWHQCQERDPRITNTTESEIYSCPVVRNDQIVTVRSKIPVIAEGGYTLNDCFIKAANLSKIWTGRTRCWRHKCNSWSQM